MKDDMVYQKLVIARAEAKTLHEKTRLEELLWDRLLRSERRQYREGRVGFLHATFGGKSNDYKDRFNLYHARDVEPLWERVESGSLKIHRAVLIYREARKRGDVADTLPAVLTEYDALPVIRADGTRARPSWDTRRVPTESEPRTNGTSNNRAFWADFRHQINEHIRREHELPHGPEIREAWAHLEADVRVAIDTFQNRIRHTTRKAEIVREVSARTLRSRLLRAHERLGLTLHKSIDIKAVRRNKRTLARQYHPDLNGGNEELTDAYREVMEAARVIELEYEKQKEKEKEKETNG